MGVNGTDSGSSKLAGFGISGVEPSVCVATFLVLDLLFTKLGSIAQLFKFISNYLMIKQIKVVSFSGQYKNMDFRNGYHFRNSQHVCLINYTVAFH
jgi:hypothetical protein